MEVGEDLSHPPLERQIVDCGPIFSTSLAAKTSLERYCLSPSIGQSQG